MPKQYPKAKQTGFTILNPYQGSGSFKKAQLHLHTANSLDVWKKEPIATTIQKYHSAGYSFLVVTDHDYQTETAPFNTADFTVLSGQETTLPFLGFLWPLGRHLIEFQIGEAQLQMPAHPHWPGNLGTGLWRLPHLSKLKNFFLLEIANHHSDSRKDIDLWHQLLKARGYQQPIWAVAVDDTDNAEPLDRGWIMVQTPGVEPDDLLKALQKGSFYATTGPAVTFEFLKGKIKVTSTTPKVTINFINSQNQIIKQEVKQTASYTPSGNEGFIRVEVWESVSGKRAWSQPFFIVGD